MAALIRFRPLSLLVACILILGGIGGGAALLMRKQPQPEEALSDDPRLSFATPYRNVRPEVAYVGDAECRRCHQQIAAKYARHPMGRSMAAAGLPSPTEPLGAKQNNPFKQLGSTFEVVHRGASTVHKELRLDSKGTTAASIELDVQYAVGSGSRGKSYLIDRGGFLFQSPISWFSEKQIWDISPGFTEHRHFSRQIGANCLFCHSNHADALPDTINGYRTPAFLGLSIGCERCHGPGALHVKERDAGNVSKGLDDTIVNPKSLESVLRESVCQQCHLQGEQRILRRGRQPFDYRPGLPLHLFWSTFVRLPDLVQAYRSVGQMEQMERSRCHQASAGALGCISCHDPHEKPTPENRVEFYTARCQSCHVERGCTAPRSEREKQKEGCIGCHMKKADSTSIAHTAVTDHRILRQPDISPTTKPRAILPDETPVQLFHANPIGLAKEEVERDLGIVLSELLPKDPQFAIKQLPSLLPRLEAAVARDPKDAAAWDAIGRTYRAAGRLDDAMTAFQHALTHSPKREASLAEAANIAGEMEQTNAAMELWQRAIAVNPWMGHYHAQLARSLARLSRWAEAQKACRKALELDPFDFDVRVLLVTACIRVDARKEAEEEFKRLIAVHPTKESELRPWFEKQIKR